jgi:hypothetical protein
MIWMVQGRSTVSNGRSTGRERAVAVVLGHHAVKFLLNMETLIVLSTLPLNLSEGIFFKRRIAPPELVRQEPGPLTQVDASGS